MPEWLSNAVKNLTYIGEYVALQQHKVVATLHPTEHTGRTRRKPPDLKACGSEIANNLPHRPELTWRKCLKFLGDVFQGKSTKALLGITDAARGISCPKCFADMLVEDRQMNSP